MKYELEIKLDSWNNDGIVFKSNVPYQNINIGDTFNTNQPRFYKIGYFKVVDKTHYKDDSTHKVSILLETK
jgi:hypothetical protein